MAGRLTAGEVWWELHDTSSSDGTQRSNKETQPENKRLRAAPALALRRLASLLASGETQKVTPNKYIFSNAVNALGLGASSECPR